MEEHWEVIEDFPLYLVSSYGQVLNRETGRLLKQSANNRGILKVGMYKNGEQYTRSVKVLVADTYLEGKNELFDTPINLDGNQANNRLDNLMWRPRHFAWRYGHQFVEQSSNDLRGPIVDLKTGVWYHNMLEAAIMNGLLVYDIWKSIQVKRPTFPTNQMFSFH